MLGKERQSNKQKRDRQTDRQTDIGFVASMHNYHQGHFKVQKDFNSLNISFLEKIQKCEKIKKVLKNHTSKTMDPTEFCHLKQKSLLFLS